MTTLSPSRAAAFSPRGPVSERLLREIQRDPVAAEVSLEGFPRQVAEAVSACDDVIRDDDLQLTLLILQCLHYGDLVANTEPWEWHADLIRARTVIERGFERSLRATVPGPDLPEANAEAVAAALFALTKPSRGPVVPGSLARLAY